MLRIHIALAFFATILLFAVANRQQKKEISPVDFKFPETEEAALDPVSGVKIPVTRFSFEELKKKARSMAHGRYVKPQFVSTHFLKGLSWDEYKNIRFKPEVSLWKKEGNPFQIQFFHPGHLYNTNVTLHEVRSDFARQIPYDGNYFDLSHLKIQGEIPPNLGYSGFKIHYPLNTQEHTDEFTVFQGASYYRMVSKKQVYGLSARGIAVNTGMSYPEDFPGFTHFWIVHPDKTDSTVFVYALLDGKTATGAYEFQISPGKVSSVHVNAEVTLRTKVDRLGIAPLTSMYWYSETRGIPEGQAYPESHDSDGLMIENGKGEWIWRPLDNPKRVTINAFLDDNPKAFGLIQRDRNFASYQDNSMKYHLRPSAWVEPEGNWGKGSVQLLQIPTVKDSDDNIGAFWVPTSFPAPLQPFEFSYTIRWLNEDPLPEELAKTVSTRVAPVPGESDMRVFYVDFSGEKLKGLDPFTYLQASIDTGENAELADYNIQKIEETGVWRLTFRVVQKNRNKPAELKAVLKKNQEDLSEIWTFTLESTI
ncbi:glucan biosynthesis protein [Leptospira ellisii]|uniref:Glucans biosynthesis protein G n=1 Tax=Leptospira ellisii TaxID=2023197 RepID=A0A2N0B7S5_9LEPT|nr:glucan biosynthesis protein [Leptospira ellisii]MDV6234667.1 glucan biosynthesis protein [Leptospira ellisii]PJZ92605.1 glucan biosynthesis protein G [Leptospira ellisii]PKA05459.1 glucan biosynthesis protein G [Leptospira ellisii]